MCTARGPRHAPSHAAPHIPHLKRATPSASALILFILPPLASRVGPSAMSSIDSIGPNLQGGMIDVRLPCCQVSAPSLSNPTRPSRASRCARPAEDHRNALYDR
ncbi:hypothetical protein L1887_48853 [Cichorium endivia]|nr:hypothetical protein L1887_48853 [Cichorium endivia]